MGRPELGKAWVDTTPSQATPPPQVPRPLPSNTPTKTRQAHLPRNPALLSGNHIPRDYTPLPLPGNPPHLLHCQATPPRISPSIAGQPHPPELPPPLLGNPPGILPSVARPQRPPPGVSSPRCGPAPLEDTMGCTITFCTFWPCPRYAMAAHESAPLHAPPAAGNPAACREAGSDALWREERGVPGGRSRPREDSRSTALPCPPFHHCSAW